MTMRALARHNATNNLEKIKHFCCHPVYVLLLRLLFVFCCSCGHGKSAMYYIHLCNANKHTRMYVCMYLRSTMLNFLFQVSLGLSSEKYLHMNACICMCMCVFVSYGNVDLCWCVLHISST